MHGTGRSFRDGISSLPARSRKGTIGRDHMVKFCRECNCLMPGSARFCPHCARRWLPVGAHHLAEAADLLQPPVKCAWCQNQTCGDAAFCPRCGIRLPPRAE
jgi:hypothetical protein